MEDGMMDGTLLGFKMILSTIILSLSGAFFGTGLS